MSQLDEALHLASTVVAQVPMLEHVAEQARKLEAVRAPPVSDWWQEQLDQVYSAPTVQRFVGQVGRRGGKSTTACRIAVAETTGRQWPIPYGDRGIFAIVSVDLKSARRRLQTCAKFLHAMGYDFTPTTDLISFRDRPIDIQVYPCTATGVLGDTWIGAVFDEMAKWKDKTGGVNPAKDVVSSARPSLASMRQYGAREWWISSPWAELGVHYGAVCGGTGPKQIVGIAPTWQANPTFTEAMTHEEEPDDIAWRREWLAVPMPRSMTGMLDSRCIRWLSEQPKDERGDALVAGADLAMKQDASSLVIANKRGTDYLVRLVEEWRPTQEKALVPSELCGAIADRLAHHGAKVVMADQHYRESLREATSSAGLILLDAPASPVDPMTRLRALLQQGLLHIYCPDPELRARLCAQIDSVQLVPTPTGLRVVHSREDGAHGDMVAALALCVWQQSGPLADVAAEAKSEREVYFAKVAKAIRAQNRARDARAAARFRQLGLSSWYDRQHGPKRPF